MDAPAGGGYEGPACGTPRRPAGTCASRIPGARDPPKEKRLMSTDSLNTRRDLVVGETTYTIYSLKAAEAAGLEGVSRLPVSIKVLLENLLRNEGPTVSEDDLKAMQAWIDNKGRTEQEIAYRPARVLMQDFTGVPAVVD